MRRNAVDKDGIGCIVCLLAAIDLDFLRASRHVARPKRGDRSLHSKLLFVEVIAQPHASRPVERTGKRNGWPVAAGPCWTSPSDRSPVHSGHLPPPAASESGYMLQPNVNWAPPSPRSDLCILSFVARTKQHISLGQKEFVCQFLLTLSSCAVRRFLRRSDDEVHLLVRRRVYPMYCVLSRPQYHFFFY